MSEWQPIETAPRDKLFLGFVPHSCVGYIGVFTWNKVLKQYQNNIDFGFDSPSHWMPLPPPPSKDA